MRDEAASFYVTGGTLSHDAPSYVERRADRDLMESLQRGEICYVLTARQMGKSSLMVRTASRLRQEGHLVAVLDLTALGRNLTPEQWYDGMLVRLGRQWDLEAELEQAWEERASLGPCQRLFTCLRDVILTRGSRQCFLFIDEIDIVRSLPFSTDEFFAAIRECYNRRGDDPVFRRLTFCLLGVAVPSDLIRDTRITPFNVARRVELNDFTEQEVMSLARGLELRQKGTGPIEARTLIRRVYHWTHGHPYLTQRLCRALVEESFDSSAISCPFPVSLSRRWCARLMVDRCCGELFFSPRARERDDNLIFVRERILRADEDLAALLHLYAQVHGGRKVIDEETDSLVSVLRLSGIVRSVDGSLVERNLIYERVFDRDWVRINMPDAEQRRQRTAFRRGVLRAAAVSAFVFGIMTVVVLYAVGKANEARQALVRSHLAEAEARLMSGQAGQRVQSLAAIAKAKVEANAEDVRFETLRDLAIRGLALVDLEADKARALPDSQATLCATDPTLEQCAWADADGVIRVAPLDVGGQENPPPIPAQDLPLDWMRLSPRARFAGAQYGAGDRHRFMVWDLQTGDSLLDLTNRVGADALDFSSDNGRLAVGLGSGELRVFALPLGSSVFEQPMVELTGIVRRPNCVRFSPDGQRLAESSESSQLVRIWDLSSRKIAANFFHADSITMLAWSRDARYLATASDGHGLQLWDVPFSRRLNVAPHAHADAILDLAFSPRGHLLASLGADRAVKLWSLGANRHLTHHLQDDPRGRLAFDDSGRRLAHVSPGQGVRMWRLHGAREYQVLDASLGVGSSFSSLCFAASDNLLLAANDVGAFLWDTATGASLPALPLKSIRCAFPDWASGDLYFGTPNELSRWPRHVRRRGSMEEWIYGPPQCVALPPPQPVSPPPVLENPKAAMLLNQQVHLLGMGSPPVVVASSLQGDFREMRISSNGKWLATWSEDEIAVRRTEPDPESWRPVQVLPGSRYFDFSRDGTILATCRNRRYRFWSTVTWREMAAPIRRSETGDPAGPVAFGPAWRNGEVMVAVTDTQSAIKVYALRTEEPRSESTRRLLLTLQSPDAKSIESLAFNAEGSRLAVSLMDRTVQVWDLAELERGLSRIGLADGLPAFAPRREPLPEVRFATGDSPCPQTSE